MTAAEASPTLTTLTAAVLAVAIPTPPTHAATPIGATPTATVPQAARHQAVKPEAKIRAAVTPAVTMLPVIAPMFGLLDAIVFAPKALWLRKVRRDGAAKSMATSVKSTLNPTSGVIF
jgi:hypothetical protein